MYYFLDILLTKDICNDILNLTNKRSEKLIKERGFKNDFHEHTDVS